MAGPPAMGEVYLECLKLGALLKVTAIDPATAIEASVFGPAGSFEELKRNAVTKLAYVLKKRANGE